MASPMRPSGKTPAWWKEINDMPSPSPSPIMSLPGELRNMVFEKLADDMEHVVICNGKIRPHPFASVNQQSREEFASIFDLPVGHRSFLHPDRVTLQVVDYDFKSAVEALSRCAIGPATKFAIQVRVTKQLFRCEWERIWPWIEYCDTLMPKEQYQGAKIRSSYDVQLELSACNPYAASQELYIEVMPYILKGAGGPGGMSAGYEEISKMRSALKNSLATGNDTQVSALTTAMPW